MQWTTLTDKSIIYRLTHYFSEQPLHSPFFHQNISLFFLPLPPFCLPLPKKPMSERQPKTAPQMKKKQESIIFIKDYMQNLDFPSIDFSLSPADNSFSLRKLATPAQLDTDLTFLPQQPTPAHAGYRCLPVFNNDGQFYTPTFVLDADKIKCRLNWELFSTTFARSQQQNNQQIDQIMVPRPAPTKNFCCVCRTHFEDYLTHLAQPPHQSATRSNPFNKDIQKLCKKVTPKVARPRGRPTGSKNKPIRKLTAKQEEGDTSASSLDNVENGIELME